MARTPRRQVTPPLWRVWSYGLVGTAIAAFLTYGWAYLCIEVWNWPIQVPRLLDTTDLVNASYIRLVGAAAAIGCVGTAGASVLARTFIGPRIWWLIPSIGIGLTSLYGALTLPGTDLAVRLRLVVFHVLVMAALVPTIAAALRISDDDLARLVRRHEATRSSDEPQIAPATPEAPTVNDTMVLPADD